MTEMTSWLTCQTKRACSFGCESTGDGFTAFGTLKASWVVSDIPLQSHHTPFNFSVTNMTSWRFLFILGAIVAKMNTVPLPYLATVMRKVRIAFTTAKTFCMEDLALDQESLTKHWLFAATTFWLMTTVMTRHAHNTTVASGKERAANATSTNVADETLFVERHAVYGGMFSPNGLAAASALWRSPTLAILAQQTILPPVVRACYESSAISARETVNVVDLIISGIMLAQGSTFAPCTFRCRPFFTFLTYWEGIRTSTTMCS